MNLFRHNRLNLFCLTLVTLGLSTVVFSQDEKSNVSVILLEHDNIAEVNIDQNPFLESLSAVIDYFNDDLKEIPESQKVALQIVAHPKGEASMVCFTVPKNDSLEDKIEKELKGATAIPNTKLVDFPILFTLNLKNVDETSVFKDFKDPIEEKKSEFKTADLATKAKLLKNFALFEGLPVLSAYEVIVEDKFPGVKNFGKLVSTTDFLKEVDVFALTDKNNDYWRANLEMEASNQLIPLTKAYMLVSQGEFDYAMRYLEIINMYSNPKTTSHDYLKELSWRMELFYAELTKQVSSGVVLHDQQKYAEAIEIYQKVLQAHPKSAWALYENYFSMNQQQVDLKEITTGDYKNWYNIKGEIYAHNPVYDVEVHASNGEEAYAMFRRQEIQQLFHDSKEIVNDLYTYGEIALDLNAPAIAAQLFWISASVNKVKQQESIHYFLYCLDKLGNTEIKTNFKGDFDKIFKKLDAERAKQMKSSQSYKMMAK